MGQIISTYSGSVKLRWKTHDQTMKNRLRHSALQLKTLYQSQTCHISQQQ